VSGELVVPASRSASLARRAAVTAAAVALLLLSQRLLLPFIDRDAMMQTFAGIGLLSAVTGGSLLFVSWGALGLEPFFAAFVLVELIAVAVPALRQLRHGSATGRARLTRAAWMVAVVLAAVQGWGLAVSLTGIRDAFGEAALASSLVPMVSVAAGAALGTVGLGASAVIVTRHGLGNGFAVLFAVEALQVSLGAAVRTLLAPRGTWTETGALLVLAAAVLPFVFAARPRGGAGPRIPVPTCGLALVLGPAAIVYFPAKLAVWVPALAPLARRIEVVLVGEAAWAAVAIPLTAALALAFSRAFCPAGDVVLAYGRAAPESLDEAATAAVRRALRSAHGRSFALAMGVAAFPAVAWGVGVPVAIPGEALFAAFIVAAVARDLGDEATARAGGAALVSAWPVHRVYAVEPVLAALARAGIPAHARSRHYRALFHVFAPFAPIEILVAQEQVGEVEAVCARVLAPPIPTATRATVPPRRAE
jgi:preprotein translocase subunit SecY